jgi:multiple sugar transport system permease protein
VSTTSTDQQPGVLRRTRQTPASSRQAGRRRTYNPVRPRRSTTLTVVMVLMLAYTLVPLLWLLLSATKDGPSLFSSF